jgi:hypothetical protein
MLAGRIGGLQQICGTNIFLGHLFKFGFFDLNGYWRARLSSSFGEIVLAKRTGFVLRFGDICIGWEGWFFPQDFII